MDKKKIAIAIPASTISDTPHLREKTAKIGLIGRAAAIFRVDEIIVYPDIPKINQQRTWILFRFCLAIWRLLSICGNGCLSLSLIWSLQEFCLHYVHRIIH